MSTVNLDLLISTITGIGPRRAAILQKRGINSLRDLLYNFPRAYKDLLKPQKINELAEGQEAAINAEIISIVSQRLFRRRMTITNATARDSSGTIQLVWFNQPFIANVIKEGENYLFYGKVSRNRKTGNMQMSSPKYERNASLVPIYSESEGLSSKQMRIVMSAVFDTIDAVDDNLPLIIRNQYRLAPLGEALKQIHRPSDADKLSSARRRLAFDELLTVVTKFMDFDKDLSRRRAPSIGIDEINLKEFVSRLPYKLTGEQRIAAWRIIKQMAPSTTFPLVKGEHKGVNRGRDSVSGALELPVRNDKGVHPLNALLNGDVGSGKTVVALLASLNVVSNGLNVVWMAPTQILARQHFETVSQLLSDTDIDVKLVTAATVSSRTQVRDPMRFLTGARNDKEEISVHPRLPSVALAKEGQNQRSPAIIIGTHALLHRRDQLRNIGLVVIDEQHRFGVEQRRALLREDDDSKLAPHFLSMTATPIPRSLAMMISGMTKLITIKEKPIGRKSIITKVVDDATRKPMYCSVEKQIARGRQVYVIAPLIEESFNEENGDPPSRKATEGFARYQKGAGSKKAAAREAENLKKVFPKRKIGLLHGKMKSAEKDKIMKQMLARTLDILVSTTVVEVGVDVPNATVMVVENANYFGLAQLHQLRGRVGRSHHQSYCYLSVVGDAGKTAQERLKIMEQTNDGFIIAQKDLELRGPGTIIGTQQAGFFDLRLASLGDTMLVEQVKEAAEYLNSN